MQGWAYISFLFFCLLKSLHPFVMTHLLEVHINFTPAFSGVFIKVYSGLLRVKEFSFNCKLEELIPK